METKRDLEIMVTSTFHLQSPILGLHVSVDNKCSQQNNSHFFSYEWQKTSDSLWVKRQKFQTIIITIMRFLVENPHLHPFLHITCRKPSIKITIKNEIKYLILMCLMKSPFTLKNNHRKIDNLVLKNNNFSNGQGSTCTIKREII